MTDTEINTIIAARERLTNRSDEQIDWIAVDHFDAVLSTVPPGQRNDVDLLLGRPAELPTRVEYQMRPATDDEYLMTIADQYADMLDWHRMCGDLAI